VSGRSNDQERFEELYRATYQDIVAYCHRRVRPGDVDDVVAGTYLVAWRRIDDFAGADSPVAWLYGVARRTIGNHRRGTGRFASLKQRILGQPADTDVSTDRTAELGEELSLALTTLGRMSPADREIIRLAAFEELSYAQIGITLGKSPAAVRSHLFRARKRLKESYDERSGEMP